MTSDDERIAYLAGDGSGALGDELDAADRDDLDELKGLLAEPAIWDAPPTALEDAVVAAVRAEAATSEPAARSTSAGVRPRRSWRRAGPWLGAAAAAAAVVVAIVVAGGQDDDPQELVVALEATDSTSDLTGTVAVTRSDSGWRFELDAPGLPRLDEGRFYEAWMKSDADVLVSLGTFNEGNDVVLWGGVRPPDFPTITITREEADGDPTSSGDRVLVGVIVVEG